MIDDKKPDNPPAFPLNSPFAVGANEGMTLRDYFAARFASSVRLPWVGDHSGRSWAEAVAKNAYELADAMLAERSNP